MGMIYPKEVELMEFEKGESWALKLKLNLDDDSKRALVELLQSNLDIFAWKLKDFPRVDPKLISHRLNIDSTKKPMQQRKRKISMEKNEII